MRLQEKGESKEWKLAEKLIDKGLVKADYNSMENILQGKSSRK